MRTKRWEGRNSPRTAYKDKVKGEAIQPNYMNCDLVMNLTSQTTCQWTKIPFWSSAVTFLPLWTSAFTFHKLGFCQYSSVSKSVFYPNGNLSPWQGRENSIKWQPQLMQETNALFHCKSGNVIHLHFCLPDCLKFQSNKHRQYLCHSWCSLLMSPALISLWTVIWWQCLKHVWQTISDRVDTPLELSWAGLVFTQFACPTCPLSWTAPREITSGDRN